MTFSAKTKLLLGAVSALGGCCAVAVPVMMSSDRDNSRPNRSVEPTGVETYSVSQELSGGAVESQEQVSTISPPLRDLVNDNLDELWTKINESFKNKQQSGRDIELPWGNELKSILRGDRKTANDWKATKQDWANCNVSAKVDYCGYLELKSGNDEYKMRVSYDGRTSQSNSWEVILVKKNGSQAKYYDGTKKKWEGPRMQWNTNFQGQSGGNNNGWNNLGITSIKMGK